MWDWNDDYAVARYNSFKVTSEADGFRLLGSTLAHIVSIKKPNVK